MNGRLTLDEIEERRRNLVFIRQNVDEGNDFTLTTTLRMQEDWLATIDSYVADLEQARGLLKGLMDYHNQRQACVHMEGPQYCEETLVYLREAGYGIIGAATE